MPQCLGLKGFVVVVVVVVLERGRGAFILPDFEHQGSNPQVDCSPTTSTNCAKLGSPNFIFKDTFP